MTKFIKMAMAVAVAGGISAQARAQTNPMPNGAITHTSYDNVEYYADDSGKSPSDKAPTPPATEPAPVAPAPAAAAAPAADAAASGDDCCKLTCPDQTVKHLFENNCWLKCHDVTVTGWIEAGYATHDGQR
ncbi:MAG TPA: hypothetical protein VG056_02160, partial [Pirellulales bacterium]|nr:hypothetical protein [Pirellulales bacterium]